MATAGGPELAVDGNALDKTITGGLHGVGALSAGSDCVRWRELRGSGVAESWFVSDVVNEAAAGVAFCMSAGFALDSWRPYSEELKGPKEPGDDICHEKRGDTA